MKHIQLVLLCAMIYGCTSKPNPNKASLSQGVDSTKGRDLMLAFIKENPHSTIVRNLEAVNLWQYQFVIPGSDDKSLEHSLQGELGNDTLFGSFGAELSMGVYFGKSFLNDPKYGPMTRYSMDLQFNKNNKMIGYYQSMEFTRYDRQGECLSDTIMVQDSSIDIKKRYFSDALYNKYVKDYNKRSRYPVQ